MPNATTNTSDPVVQHNDSSALKDQSFTARKRNAFSELMSPKVKLQKTPELMSHSESSSTTPVPRSINPNHFSQALLPYIQHPENYPTEVINFTDQIVLLKDKFPKSIVHLLLCARDPKYHNMNPLDAFSKEHDSDGSFLALMKHEADKARSLAASELRRLIGKHSSRQKTREQWLDLHRPDSDDKRQVDEKPPTGRDYTHEIRIGVHAQPSMASLHIHIISRDMAGEKLKHKKHYNSFNTPFFVELTEFPLLQGDNRLDREHREELLRQDLKCWRCGKDFKNQFAKLTGHLKEEVHDWKQA